MCMYVCMYIYIYIYDVCINVYIYIYIWRMSVSRAHAESAFAQDGSTMCTSSLAILTSALEAMLVECLDLPALVFTVSLTRWEFTNVVTCGYLHV